MNEYYQDPLEKTLNTKFRIRWDRIFGGLGVGIVSMALLTWAYSIFP